MKTSLLEFSFYYYCSTGIVPEKFIFFAYEAMLFVFVWNNSGKGLISFITKCDGEGSMDFPARTVQCY